MTLNKNIALTALASLLLSGLLIPMMPETAFAKTTASKNFHFTKQPGNKTVTKNKTATFTVSTSKSRYKLHYQWYMLSSKGKHYTKVKASSAKKRTLKIKGTTSLNKAKLYVKVWNKKHKHTSKKVHLYVTVPKKAKVAAGVSTGTNVTSVLQTTYGADVSLWQAKISYAGVAKTKQFVLIRAGASSYYKTGAAYSDQYYNTNVVSARANGLNIGHY